MSVFIWLGAVCQFPSAFNPGADVTKSVAVICRLAKRGSRQWRARTRSDIRRDSRNQVPSDRAVKARQWTARTQSDFGESVAVSCRLPKGHRTGVRSVSAAGSLAACVVSARHPAVCRVLCVTPRVTHSRAGTASVGGGHAATPAARAGKGRPSLITAGLLLSGVL